MYVENGKEWGCIVVWGKHKDARRACYCYAVRWGEWVGWVGPVIVVRPAMLWTEVRWVRWGPAMLCFAVRWGEGTSRNCAIDTPRLHNWRNYSRMSRNTFDSTIHKILQHLSFNSTLHNLANNFPVHHLQYQLDLTPIVDLHTSTLREIASFTCSTIC